MFCPICSTYLSKAMKINSLFTGEKRICKRSHVNYNFCWTLTFESFFFFFLFPSAENAPFIKLEIFTLEMRESCSKASSFLSSAPNMTPLQWYLCALGYCVSGRFDCSTLAKPKFSYESPSWQHFLTGKVLWSIWSRSLFTEWRLTAPSPVKYGWVCRGEPALCSVNDASPACSSKLWIH